VTEPGEEKPPVSDFDRRDLLGIVGLFCLALGCAFVYPPAGLIVPGAIITAIAVFGVRG
jgi:hypothetical protein